MAYRKFNPWGTQKPPYGVEHDYGHPLSDKLVAHWLFTENQGKRLINLVNKRYNATITSSANPVPWRRERFGASIPFDGSGTTFATLANTLSLGTSDFAIVVWAKGSTSQTASFISNANPSSPFNGFSFGPGHLNASGTGIDGTDVSLWVTSTAYDSTHFTSYGTATGVLDGKWHCFAASRQGTSVPKIWIDGLAKTLTAYSVATKVDSSGGASTYIGQDPSDAKFIGSIAHIRVYKRALSTWEVRQLVASPFCDMIAPRRQLFIGTSPGNAYVLTADAGAYTLTGVATGLYKGSRVTAVTGTYALTGVAANLYKNSRVTAVTGSYSLTGVAAGLYKGSYTSLLTGAYALTGVSSSLLKGSVISPITGSYSLTGVSANLYKDSGFSAAAGSYALTGVAAGLYKGFAVIATTGSYALTGVAAGLYKTNILSAVAGAYALTGKAAGLYYNVDLVANTGSYTLTGVAAALRRSHILTAVVGAYTLTGVPAVLSRGKYLSASAGSYVLTGNAATFTRGFSFNLGAGAYVLSGEAIAFYKFRRDLDRTVMVDAEDRVFSVEPEDRSFRVAPEDRTFMIEPEDRVLMVEPEVRIAVSH